MRESWLTTHLETFVKPQLGFIPPARDNRWFSPSEMAVIKNLWRSGKRAAAGRPVLLAGRDVWIFEVLARRENFPTVFRPDISRLTADLVIEDYSKHFIIDTGFSGSIPRALGSSSFAMASAGRADKYQIFPNLRGSRNLALRIEGLPKYWRRGFAQNEEDPVKAGTIGQDLSSDHEFEQAAILTQVIYRDSSPAFVNEKNPVRRILRDDYGFALD